MQLLRHIRTEEQFIFGSSLLSPGCQTQNCISLRAGRGLSFLTAFLALIVVLCVGMMPRYLARTHLMALAWPSKGLLCAQDTIPQSLPQLCTAMGGG